MVRKETEMRKNNPTQLDSPSKIAIFFRVSFIFFLRKLIKQHCKNIGEIHIEKEIVQGPLLYCD